MSKKMLSEDALLNMLEDLDAANAKLMESQEKYQDLYDNAPAMFASVDHKTGKVIRCNNTLLKKTGYTRKEVIGKHILTRYATKKEAEQAFKQFLKTGVVKNAELALKKKGGGEIVGLLNVASVRDEKGNILHSRSVWQDITERKNVEKALKLSDKILNKAQEVAHIGSWHLDVVNNKLSWSDEIYRIFGLKPQEFGATYEAFLKAVHPDDRDAVSKAYSDSLKNKTPYEIEHRIVLPNGEIKHVQEKCENVFDKKGKPLSSLGVVQDITDTVMYRKALEESEEKLRSIIENIPEVVWSTDENGHTNYISPNVKRAYGYTPEEILKNPDLWFGRIHPEDVERVGKEFKATITTGKKFNTEYRVQRKDGEWIWLHDRGTRVYDEKGRRYLEGIFADVTERKKAEETILAEKNFSDKMIDSLPGIFYLYNDRNEFVRWNGNFETATGYSAKEISRMNPLDFFSKEEGKLVKNVLAEIKKKGQWAGEMNLRRKDGKTVRYYFSTLLFKLQGRYYGLGTGVDVTAKAEAERALKESEEKFRDITERSFDIIYQVDPNGNFTYTSPAVKKILGYSTEELVGKSIKSLVKPSDLPSLFKNFKRTLNGEQFAFESPILAKDGSERIMEIYTQPLILNKKVVGTQGTARDVTEKKKAREILEDTVAERTKELREANEQLKAVDKLKSLFIASMSHELRTPLNSIIGFTGIILQGMSGEINDVQRKQLSIVKSSSQQLLVLINDIIDLSKVEAGKVEIEVEKFNLANIIKEVNDELSIKAKEKKLKLSVKTPKDLIVIGDERRTKQVIINLVNNAIKYSDKGTIKTTAAKTGNKAVITVADTGLGIKKTDMDKLFTAFTQIRSKNQVKTEGAGLGLYLSKKIATMLEGDLTGSSKFGKGSVFTFTIPLKRKKVKK